MSEIYDNWERLVAAVLRKEELWALFHAQSRSPSNPSETSSDSSSSFRSCHEIEELARNSDNRDDQMTREIIPVPRQEDHITGIPEFQENKKIIVLKLDKTNEKAMMKVSGPSGVEAIAAEIKDKKLTVTGDIDPVTLVRSLGKLRYVEVASVGRLKENSKSSDISSSTLRFNLETEERQSLDFNPSLRSPLKIEELTADECERSSDSRIDQTVREIVPIPRQESRITRTSTFQENKMTDFCLPFFRGIFQRRNEMTSVYCKVVLILHLANDKTKQKAMKRVISFSGVESVALDGKEKKLTVIGNVDPVALARSLRKLCLTELLLVKKI